MVKGCCIFPLKDLLRMRIYRPTDCKRFACHHIQSRVAAFFGQTGKELKFNEMFFYLHHQLLRLHHRPLLRTKKAPSNEIYAISDFYLVYMLMAPYK